MNDLPRVGSRWTRKEPYDPYYGPFNGYTIMFVTNSAHRHERHPRQVVYKGDNNHIWSLPLTEWPGNLIPIGDSHD